MRPIHFGLVSILITAGVSSASCSGGSSTSAPTASAEVAKAEASASAVPSASGALNTVVSPATIPVLSGDKFPAAGANMIYAVEGAIVVSDEARVGRLSGDKIEWIDKSLPQARFSTGSKAIRGVAGRWPDEIGVLVSDNNGRAPEPSYFPLTGKGMAETAAPGGGWGDIRGVARIGDSTIIAVDDLQGGPRLVTVRGATTRTFAPAESARCTDEEIPRQRFLDRKGVALIPRGFESTPAGSLVSVGALCEKRGPAAEIWDRAGKSRIVDLGAWWKAVDYSPDLLKGSDDELFVVNGQWGTILHVHDGAIDPVPDLAPIEHAFTSPDGKLHVSDGKTIFRLDDGRWKPVARLDGGEFSRIVFDGETYWAAGGGSIFKLREKSRETYDASCTSPFVYLFAETYSDPPTYDYPHTREKLVAFPGFADLALVEFEKGGTKQIGVKVKSREQGEALVAFVREKMKDDEPMFACYEPAVKRRFEIKAPEKKK